MRKGGSNINSTQQNTNAHYNPAVPIFSALLIVAVAVSIYWHWYTILAYIDYSEIHNAIVQHYNTNGTKEDYQPVNIAMEITGVGPGWVTVNTTVDTKLLDDSYDVAWNRLNVMQIGNVWTVQSQSTIGPCLSGSSAHNGASQVDAFVAFTENPTVDYLAGPARQSFIMYPLDSENYKQLNISLADIVAMTVFSSDKMMVENYQYKVNDKDVVCDVTYYRTLEGWKIVQVDQKTF